MRQTITFGIVLLLCGFAAGQAVVYPSGVAGWATPGMVDHSFVPLISTPSVQLGATPFAPAGASNATPGNVAGASNSTLSIVSTAGGAVFAQPMWYGSNGTDMPSAGNAAETSATTGSVAAQSGLFQTGAAVFQDSYSVIQLGARAKRQTSRVYTNQDIARIQQLQAVVRFGDKPQSLN